MEITTALSKLDQIDVDGIVLGIFGDGSCCPAIESEVLVEFTKIGGFSGKSGEKRLVYNIPGIAAKRIALVGLGNKEELNHEVVRSAAGLGVKLLRDDGAKTVGIASFDGDAELAGPLAEGCILGLYRFEELMTMNPDKRPNLDKLIFCGSNDEANYWDEGVVIAEAQNFARRMGELPANIATPTFFTKETKKKFDGVPNVEIKVYDEAWAKEQKMGAFLSVAAGSDEPAKFMVIEYRGGSDDQKPYAVIGKGITFDTGGISLKGSSGMGAMRGDCSGAAATIGTLLGLAKLKVPINAIGVTPLTENMPSGKATKPSDVVFASNGKSIEIDNTDAEGRLILSDALVYTEKTYDPHMMVDIATLTGAMMVALGEHYVGAFCKSDTIWEALEASGKATAEEFWRMPLDKKYSKQLKSTIADLKNVGGRPAGSITAAMFLSEFVERDNWAHLDIAGVTWPSTEGPYKPKGNVGMPVRALIDMGRKLAS